ncbi:DAF36 desaturase, partial [Acromyrmex insinuator]
YQFFQKSKEALSTFWTHCSHLGANMAEGGRVKGDCLECPFHNWKFREEDGYCENIPYTIKVIRVINNFLQNLCELLKMYCTWNVKHAQLYILLYFSTLPFNYNKVSIAFQCHTIVILVIDMCKVAASLFANIVFSYNHSQTRLYLQLGHSHAHTDSWAFAEWKKGESIDVLNTRAKIIIFRFDGLKMACPSFLKDISFLLSSKQYPSTPKPAAATTCADIRITENGPDISTYIPLWRVFLVSSALITYTRWQPNCSYDNQMDKDEDRLKGVSIHPIENDNGNHHFTVAQNRDRSREKHKANVHLCHKLMLLERFSIMESDVRAEQIRPGIIELNVNTSFGSLYILLTITLIELLLQRVIYLIFSPPLLAPYANLLFAMKDLQW